MLDQVRTFFKTLQVTCMLREPCASLSSFSKCFRAFLIKEQMSLLSMPPFLPDIDHDCFTRYLTVRDNDHDVCVGREHIDKCREVWVPDLSSRNMHLCSRPKKETLIWALEDLHGLEVCRQFWATQLELLDNVWYLLKPDQTDDWKMWYSLRMLQITCEHPCVDAAVHVRSQGR